MIILASGKAWSLDILTMRTTWRFIVRYKMSPSKRNARIVGVWLCFGLITAVVILVVNVLNVVGNIKRD